MMDGDDDEGHGSPEDEVAYEALVRKATIGARLEAQLKDPTGAITLLLKRAREESVGALVALIELDPGDFGDVLKLQNEARRYPDLCRWMDEALDVGKEAEGLLTDADQQTIEDLANPNKETDA